MNNGLKRQGRLRKHSSYGPLVELRTPQDRRIVVTEQWWNAFLKELEERLWKSS